MTRAPRRSAEERYGQCLANAQILHVAAARLAGESIVSRALAAAWGADVYAAQAVLWERIMGAAASSTRGWFRAAEAFIAETTVPFPREPDPTTCGDILRGARRQLLTRCDDGLADSITLAGLPTSALDDLPAPGPADLAASARERLSGMTPRAFVEARRVAAETEMAAARSLRVAGDTSGAVQAAYAADYLAFEAYLVESAVALGDSDLLTVTIRWELGSAGIQHLQGLPEGFVPGVTAIREALASGLSDADGARMLASLPPL